MILLSPTLKETEMYKLLVKYIHIRALSFSNYEENSVSYLWKFRTSSSAFIDILLFPLPSGKSSHSKRPHIMGNANWKLSLFISKQHLSQLTVLIFHRSLWHWPTGKNTSWGLLNLPYYCVSRTESLTCTCRKTG